MAWKEITVVEVPGLTAEDRQDLSRQGFTQWADVDAAYAWIKEAYRLTRPEVEQALTAGQTPPAPTGQPAAPSPVREYTVLPTSNPALLTPLGTQLPRQEQQISPNLGTPLPTQQQQGQLYPSLYGTALATQPVEMRSIGAVSSAWNLQWKGTVDAFKALENAWVAMNLRWQYWPPATALWQSEYGSFDPDAPLCEIVTGPAGFWGRGPQLLKATEQWYAMRGQPVPTTQVIRESSVTPEQTRYLADVRQWERDRTRFLEVGGTDPGPKPVLPEGMPPLQYDTRTAPMNALLVVPAFLNYKSRAVIRNTSIRESTVANQSFDGLFTGQGCGPHEVPVEYPWNWFCWRWDDAPLTTMRILPPLNWSFAIARKLAELMWERGPRNIISDTRTRAILINVARMREYETTQDDLDTSVIDTVKKLRSEAYLPAKDQATLNTIATTTCSIATGINPVAGAICAGIAAAIKGLLSSPIIAHGCDTDEWRQPVPSAVEPRISFDDPPKYTVTLPRGFTFTVQDLLILSQTPFVLTLGKSVVDKAREYPPPVSKEKEAQRKKALKKEEQASSGSGFVTLVFVTALVGGGIAMLGGSDG